jgi:hypothetical protein
MDPGRVAVMVVSDARLSKWLIVSARRRQSEILAMLLAPPFDPSRLLILCSRGMKLDGGCAPGMFCLIQPIPALQ